MCKRARSGGVNWVQVSRNEPGRKAKKPRTASSQQPACTHKDHQILTTAEATSFACPRPPLEYYARDARQPTVQWRAAGALHTFLAVLVMVLACGPCPAPFPVPRPLVSGPWPPAAPRTHKEQITEHRTQKSTQYLLPPPGKNPNCSNPVSCTAHLEGREEAPIYIAVHMYVWAPGASNRPRLQPLWHPPTQNRVSAGWGYSRPNRPYSGRVGQHVGTGCCPPPPPVPTVAANKSCTYICGGGVVSVQGAVYESADETSASAAGRSQTNHDAGSPLSTARDRPQPGADTLVPVRHCSQGRPLRRPVPQGLLCRRLQGCVPRAPPIKGPANGVYRVKA